jgi:hypothetical protein
MNIDRHNYEEFFILYLDNELSSEDRRQVELFVQSHPDLKEELEMLQQVQLSPDNTVSFDNKESLVRYADCDITTDNYDEWLVLYIDNELTAKQREIVESFVATHPDAKTELELLKKTKLQPEEAIVFANKESLYRKEETKRRVIAMRWWRIAAAAVLFIAIATVSFLLTDSNIPGPGPKTAQQGTTDNASKEENSQNTPSVSKNQPRIGQPAPVNEATQPDDREVKNNKLAVSSTDKKNINNNRPIEKVNNVDQPNNDHARTQNVIASTTVDNNRNNLPDAFIDPNMDGSIRNRASFDQNTTSTAALTNSKPNEPMLAVTYTTPQPYNSTEGDNEVAQPEKKSKLRGIFRMIARTIEKKTNIKATDEQDRLLIGGLAIKL